MRLLFIPLICLATLLQAQVYDTNKYGPYSQVRFSFMPALYNNLDYVNEGADLFRSSVGLGGEVVVSYGHGIWKGFGINIGGGIGFVPYNFSFEVVPDSTSIISDDEGTLEHTPYRSAQLLLTFPFLLEKKLLLFPEDKIFLNLEAGIKWNVLLDANGNFGGGYFTRTDDGGDVRYFDYRFTNVEADEAEFISYVFKAGLLKVNQKGNSFSWNLVFHRSPTRILSGTYQFNELGYESFGTTELYDNYIGMELIFGLSLDRNSYHH